MPAEMPAESLGSVVRRIRAERARIELTVQPDPELTRVMLERLPSLREMAEAMRDLAPEDTEIAELLTELDESERFLRQLSFD